MSLEEKTQEEKLLMKRKSECIIDHVSPKELCSSEENTLMYCINCDTIYRASPKTENKYR